MRLKDSFEDFLTGRVNLDPTRVGRVQSAHNTIRDKVAALEDVKPLYVGAYLQGSYALRTAVRPAHDDHEYDVDVVLALDLRDAHGRLYGGDAVFDWLYGLVDGVALYKGKVERRERCLRVRYASDGQRFHLDVLPAHQPVVTDDPILIPPDWAATNPRGYTRWLDGVVRDRCRRARHLARLLKFWRSLQYPDGAFAPNSMVLTTLVGLCAPADAADGSLDEALVLTMCGVNGWLQGLRPFEEVVVENPSLEGENLARSWSWAEVSTFRGRFAEATRLAEAALASDDEEEAVALWNDDALFGGLFPKTLRGLGREAKGAAAAMASGGLFVGPGGAVGTSPSASGVRVRDNRGFYGRRG